MTLIRFKNQTEYAFLTWMGGFPESHHFLDDERFYRFVKCIARYRAKKWRDREYFEQRVLAHTLHFSPENIDYFWDKLQTCLHYHTTPYLDTRVENNGTHGYKQIGVKNGEIYEIDITKAETLHKGRKV